MIINQKNITFIWSLLFFSIALISFPPLHIISNFLITILFVLIFFKTHSFKITRTTQFFIIIFSISTINQLLYFDKYEWDKDSLILISTLMTILVAEVFYIPNKIFDFLILNSVPVIILSLLGGLTVVNGRLLTEFLNPNIQGIFYIGGFCASLYYIVKLQYFNIYNLSVLLGTAAFLVLSGSRKNIILIIFALLINFLSFKSLLKSIKNPLHKFFIFTGFLLITFYIVNFSYSILGNRFGENNTISKIEGVDEYSAQERLSFIKTGFEIAEKYPFGLGYGNIKEGIEEYGDIFFKVSQNPHSLLAELTIGTGYIGIFLFIIYFIYILKISFKNFTKWYFVPIFLIISFFTLSILGMKILWIVLVFFEKELIMNSKVEPGNNEEQIYI